MRSRGVFMKTEATRMGQGIQGRRRTDSGRTEARVEADAGAHSWTNAEPNALMEQALERPNLMRAYQRVVSNKGAAGVDQMPVTALKSHLQQHWPTLRERLLAGDYHPQPVRRVEYPQAARRRADTGYPDGTGSPDPTGASSGIEPDAGADLLGSQLRVPPRSKRPSGGQGDAAAYQ